MKFLPTIDLWDEKNHNDLFSGKLKLQKGQWVRCGNSKPSRFVKVSRTSIYAVHPPYTAERLKLAFAQW